jgi:hypothetical protein
MSRDNVVSVIFFGAGCVFLFLATSQAPSYYSCNTQCRHQKEFRTGSSLTNCYQTKYYDCDKCVAVGCVADGNALAGDCQATGQSQSWRDGTILIDLCTPAAWSHVTCYIEPGTGYYNFEPDIPVDIFTCDGVTPT